MEELYGPLDGIFGTQIPSCVIMLERYFYTMVDNWTIDELFGISLSMSSRIQVQADRTFQL